jgi:alkanesulfonate monooxygenase SsuD/methylene tetrahydromethanopterin reductase-like flavin-dependent oxidoreductase (luciferase family)
MKVGVVIPQGWVLEYVGWEAAAAWARTVEVAAESERLGFESIWMYDHFHTWPQPSDSVVFEPFVSLSALAGLTRRVRIGHIVICTGFRNPALTAKMISTLDVVSRGRAELGIGAGWKQEEWEAFGYDFPSTRVRLATLRDHLEVIIRMLEPGVERARFEGRYAHVAGAINQPKPLQQPRVPVMVGGNGPEVTWRLAARFADELNLDGLTPPEVAEALPLIRARCEEIGRDPATLALSVHTWRESPGVSDGGQRRVDLYAGYAELGVSRVQSFIDGMVDGPEALESFAADLRAAGVELEPEA